MKLPILESIGMNATETQVYDLLLSLGPTTAGNLISATKLKRATVYDALDRLIEKGLASKSDKNKKTQYQPLSPTNLLGLAENQASTINRAKADIQTALPDLMSSYILNVGKPVIQYFEGVEGIKTLIKDSLEERKPILSIVQSRKLPPDLYSWLHSYYKRERVKRGITRTIINSGTWTEGFIKNDPKELRKSKIVEEKKYGFQNEMNIYGDKVAIINNPKGDKLIGVLINNPLIAATLRSWFELTWSRLP